MIKNVIDLLKKGDWYVGDPDIDFAKGSNHIPKTLKQLIKLTKRKSIKTWQRMKY